MVLSRRAGSLSTTTSSGVPSGRCEPSTNTSSPGHGQRSARSAGSKVVRPISTASQRSWNSTKPYLSGEYEGSTSWTGQPSGVVTWPSRLMDMRVRISIGEIGPRERWELIAAASALRQDLEQALALAAAAALALGARVDEADARVEEGLGADVGVGGVEAELEEDLA